MKTSGLAVPGVLIALACATPVIAQPVITSTEIAENVYVVHTVFPSAGFQMNSMLLRGTDGVVLVDTLNPGPYVPFHAVIHGLTGGDPVGTIVNTSWHFDHVGLNAMFVLQDGTGTIVGHRGMGEYMTEARCLEGGLICNPPAPAEAQPTLEVHGEQCFPFGTETILVKTLENAHSGADLFVYLKEANVVYTGDVYFGGMYPIIDRLSGGTVNGTLAAVNQILDLIDEDTIVVPSHGPVGNRESMIGFADMLKGARQQVRALIARGLTEEEVMAHASFAELDAEWGHGFIDGPTFRMILYRDLTSQK